VWDDDHWEVQTTQPVKVCWRPFRVKVLALDAGITEVFTDQRGERYGTEYGQIVAQVDERLVDTGKKRNRIRHAARHMKFADESAAQRHQAKVKKTQSRTEKAKAAAETSTSGGGHHDQPRYPWRASPRSRAGYCGRLGPYARQSPRQKMSRQVSLWTRSILQERRDFKMKVRGSHQQAVASAYTSQECSQCGYTAKDNRHGDHFRCLWCGTVDTADGNAAKVILKRSTDPEIKLWMKKEAIKTILDQRHARITGETLAPVVKDASLV
jgi:hypothetical protein